MAGPPRHGHPAACLARANRIVPAAPAGGRSAARPCRPSGFLGPRRPACRQGAAGRAPRDHRTAQPKGGRGAKTDGQACGGSRWRSCPRPPRPAKPTGKPIRHAAGRPKGAWAPVRRPGALRGASDSRGQDPGTGTAHARRRLPACQRAPDGRGQRRQGGAGGRQTGPQA